MSPPESLGHTAEPTPTSMPVQRPWHRSKLQALLHIVTKLINTLYAVVVSLIIITTTALTVFLYPNAHFAALLLLAAAAFALQYASKKRATFTNALRVACALYRANNRERDRHTMHRVANGLLAVALDGLFDVAVVLPAGTAAFAVVFFFLDWYDTAIGIAGVALALFGLIYLIYAVLGLLGDRLFDRWLGEVSSEADDHNNASAHNERSRLLS